MTSRVQPLLIAASRTNRACAIFMPIFLWPIVAWAETGAGQTALPALQAVKTWDYQLRRLDVAAAAGRPSDMIVVEAGNGGDGTGVRDAADVAQLRIKPDGGRRLVIAYLSIGEAEDYRAYWQPAWRETPPAWLIGENCRWPRNYLVRFWMPEWQALMIGSANSALARVIELGFDGVYLDRVDVYQDAVDLGLIKSSPARAAMIQFVRDLSARAKALRTDFKVIVQNAEELLDSKSYRAAIDAVAKEDLLHGLKGTGVRNAASDISDSREALKRLRADGKPVFAIEYLTSDEQIATARAELARNHFTPVFPTRGLDGNSPVSTAGPALSNQQGTPEYGAATCDGLLTPRNARH
jgi:cysteinyl-tRNA synthetase, unknown class